MHKKIGLIIFCFLAFIFAGTGSGSQTPGNSPSAENITWTQNAKPKSFSWTPAPSSVGIAGYKIYWGKDSQGQDEYNWVETTSYDPSLCDHNLDGDADDLEDTGNWYLRIQAVDLLGNVGSWHTVLTYQYDGVAPDLSKIPVKVEELTNNLPTRITWQQADDAMGKGVDRYRVYWGKDPNGMGSSYTGSCQYDPVFYGYGKYYLRIQAIDKLENESNWQTVYVCEYLPPLPQVETSGEESKVFDKTDTYTIPQGKGNPSKTVLSKIIAIGGGGGGGFGSGGGGAAGQAIFLTEYPVIANNRLNIMVGTGGSGGYSKVGGGSKNGKKGTESKLIYANNRPIVTADGGDGGKSDGTAGQQYNAGGNNGQPGQTGSFANGKNLPGGKGNKGGGGAGGYISQPTNQPAKDGNGKHCGKAGQGYGAGGGGGSSLKNGGNGAQGYVAFTVKYYYESQVNPVNVIGQSAWTNQDQPPIISWQQPALVRYDIKGYNIYWGQDETATSEDNFQRSTVFAPPKCTQAGIHYLRIQTVDVHNNKSPWQTVYTYRFDDEIPGQSLTNSIIDWNNSTNNNGKALQWEQSEDSLSGIKGYQIYFGQNPQGTATNFINNNQQEINCVTSTKNYYLRIRAVDQAGNYGQWQTVYTYRFDNIPPKTITTKKVVDWTKNPNPGEIAWEQVVDYGGSGLAGYHVYWGIDPQGTATTIITDNKYSPSSCQTDAIYYLRVQAIDHAGNTCDWQNVLTYHYDTLPPKQSATNTTEGWTNVADRDKFIWEIPDDNGGSGIKQYQIYWGESPDAQDANQNAVITNSFDPPQIVAGRHTYYLRIKPIDKVGNEGQWQTVLTYKFNDQVPSGVTTFWESSWTKNAQYINNSGTTTYTWNIAKTASGANVSKYRVYWGTEAQGISSMEVATNSYNVPICDQSKIYYLRVQSLDNLDNTLEGPWKTVLVYKYDNQAPGQTTTQQVVEWKNTFPNYQFNWLPSIDSGSGTKGYNIYFGTDADSVIANKTAMIGQNYFYIQGASKSGIYYLRIQPFDNLGNEGQWQTVLTYKFDNDKPSFSESIFQGSSDPTSDPKAPAQQWLEASDDHSGVAGYEVYWGNKSNGSTGFFQESNKFDPPECTERTVHYLRVRAKDHAGNFGIWKNVYTYKYDRLSPIHFQQTVTSDWTTNSNPGKITWTEAQDNGSAGLKHYCIYWGTNATGEGDQIITDKNEYTPDRCQESGIHYLRVKLVDNAENSSAWQTYYVYRYDQQAPVMDFETITLDWTSKKDPDNIVWEQADETKGIGLKGYYVYWGKDAQGIKEDSLQVENSFDPPACEENASFYLRVKTVDLLENTSQWKTVLVYRYDDIDPEGSSTRVSKDWTTQSNPNSQDGYFYWQSAEDNCCGISYYYYYWGKDPQGINFENTKVNKLQLPACESSGTYYLRIMPVDFADNRGQWQTIYQYQFDNSAPENLPVQVTGNWTNIAKCPLYQWQVTDNHSGIAGNYIYWGRDPQGEAPEDVQLSEKFEYDPPICEEIGNYYLRIKAVDKLGNVGQWQTIFTYRYDNIVPQTTDTAVVSEWTKEPQSKKVDWLPVTDTGGSEIGAYNLYWGTDQDGDQVTIKVFDCQYLPPKCVNSNIHYLRVQAVDNAGNTGNWKTVLEYRYDNQPPKNPVEPKIIGWSNVDNFAYREQPWTEIGGSGVIKYQMYLKKPDNSLVFFETTQPEQEFSKLDTAGEYLLYVRAIDQLGNLSNWEDVMITPAITYRYDAIAPGNTITRTTSDWTTNDDCPEFGWQMPQDNISGIAGHYVYWGKDPEGEDEGNFITDNSYNPPACEQQGIHYLRVLSKDGAGNTGQWTTVYAYLFASEPPGEIPAVISDWTNESDCQTITWQSASDPGGSGIKGYDLYWGTDENGTNDGAFQTENSYDPPVCLENKIYYLRLKPYDNAGNVGSWQTVFTYRYEALPPGNSSSAQVQHNWSNNPQPETVQWNKAHDFGDSGIGGYHVYWGQQEDGKEIIAEVQDCQYQPSECTADGNYYLRIRSFDNAGNLGQWQTIMIYQYDNLAPEKITTKIVSDWTNQTDPQTITWLEPRDQGRSGIAGYNFYWGTDSEGVSQEKIAVNRYNPPQCAEAITHYLRVRAYDHAGNQAQWQTVYTYQLSTQIPQESQTDIAQEGWTNVADRSVFTWEEVSDSVSGIAGYYVYWGMQEQGTSDNLFPGNSFDPPHCETTGVYYLRIKPVDNANNQGVWQTVLIYKYTDQEPGASLTYLEKPWTNQSEVGKVTWDIATDPEKYGIDGYFIYWGQEEQGTGESYITTNNYMPTLCDQEGIYYLRICPVNKPGNKGQWQTILRYAYEITKPEFVVSEIITQEWTNVAQPTKVDWSMATDSGGSKLKGYNLYWGPDIEQAEAKFFTPTNSWLPVVCTLDIQYHLLVQAVDHAGNVSEWQKVLTYEYDGQAPPLSASEEISSYSKVADPAEFSWQEVVDESGSGFRGYQVRWVTNNSSVETGVFSATNSFDPPACQQSGIYYLQVKSLDKVGNASDWQNVLTYRYDQTIPEVVMIDPLPGKSIAKKQKFIFKVLDNLSGINQESLVIKINDILTDYESMEAIEGGYLVTVQSVTDFTNNQEVRLKIQIADNLVNLLDQELVFQVEKDQTAPVIKNTTTTFDENNTQLSFEIIEEDSEIVKNSISVVINSISYNSESPTVKCTSIANGYLLLVDASAFLGESVVNVLVTAKNTSGYGAVCNDKYGDVQEQPDQPQEESDVVRSNGGTNEQVYSYPNPFSPSKQNELTLVFEAKKQEYLEILVYNIKGQIVWRTTADADAGRNIIKWDGQDAFGRKLANGIYFLFVVNSEKKVIYKGRMCAVD